MKAFVAPVEDILFSLEQVAGAGRLDDWDSELSREVTQHFAQFAESEIAPIDEDGDKTGCRLEDGRVRMPESYRRVYNDYVEQGWPSLTIPEEFDGQGMGAAVHSAVSEIFSGACVSLQMVTGLVPGAVRTLLHFGSDEQKQRNIPPMASGEWLSTMCLTEPGAGSDLSAIRTRAVETDAGWRITGEKIFISGGDQDMSEGVFHLVLARSGELSDGVKGLSLFLCRSEREDGSRNSISVTRIEEKMGLHASPTCQLAFDEAEAELVGNEGDGLKAMFTMMNHARLDVGLQGVAHAARAADIARSYAAERKQGRNFVTGAPETIDQHADVARMLDEQDALAVGSRALCHVALVEMESGDNPALVEFLTPLCKVLGTEAGMRAANLGIQVLGGYGYLQEYRVEQTWRDARITAIYEGANGIHALALATRLLRLNKGAIADAFVGFVEATLAETGEDAVLRELLAKWQQARANVLASERPDELAHDFMQQSCQLAYLAVWAKVEAKADASVDADRLRRLAARVRADAAAGKPLYL